MKKLKSEGFFAISGERKQVRNRATLRPSVSQKKILGIGKHIGQIYDNHSLHPKRPLGFIIIVIIIIISIIYVYYSFLNWNVTQSWKIPPV